MKNKLQHFFPDTNGRFNFAPSPDTGIVAEICRQILSYPLQKNHEMKKTIMSNLFAIYHSIQYHFNEGFYT